MLSGRPALAGVPGRVAMRGRHAAELTHALAREMRAGLTVRQRRLQQLRRQLEAFDLGRRLGGIRTRLVTADGRLAAATTPAHHRADARFRAVREPARHAQPAGGARPRLRGLLDRRWRADPARASTDVNVGDAVRVTLATGELDCEVRRTTT